MLPTGTGLPQLDESVRQALVESLMSDFLNLLDGELIRDDLNKAFLDVYLPLASWLAASHSGVLEVIGVNGAQGAGKSTLAKILKLILTRGFNKRTEVLSLDDFYLRRSEREALASEVHPLFRTRGVPGTHDVGLANATIEKLRTHKSGEEIRIPRFNKSVDDRYEVAAWTTVTEPIDFLVFEGWCVGAKPQSNQQLQEPVNLLEAKEDTEGRWRTASNQALAGDYQELFSQIDRLLMLKVPSMEAVFEWRSLQESRLGKEASMGEDELRRFIMHYERLTRAQLDEMPQRADIVLNLGANHQVESVTFQPGSVNAK